jgi:uncharacterized membrane protein
VCGWWWRSNSPLKVDLRGFVFDVNAMQLIAELVPSPGGDWCSASAINNAGTVCGTRSIGPSNTPPKPQNAFIWSQANGYVDLGLINGRRNWAADLNDSGTVVGGIGSVGNAYLGARGFILDASGITILPPVPGGNEAIATSWATAVNADGTVIGQGHIPARENPFFVKRAFIYRDSQIERIDPLEDHTWTAPTDIADSGVVFGVASASPTLPAAPFLWQDGDMVDFRELLGSGPPFSGFIVIHGVNRHGIVTGQAANSRGDVIAFVANPGSWHPADLDLNCRVNVSDLLRLLAAWGGDNPSADINDDGLVNQLDLLLLLDAWTAE